jgi:RNase P subunit RPR2
MDMRVEIKPTAHSTHCKFCHREIKKGDFRVVIRSYAYHAQESEYLHVPCLQNWIRKEMRDILATKDIMNPSRRDHL